MSDPVSRAEIEDILASIRRLVSEDARFEPGRAPGRGGRGGRPGRLVLTPSLRVAAPGPQVDADERDQASGAGTAVVADVEADRPAVEPAGNADPLGHCADPGEHVEPWRDPEATLFEAVRGEGVGGEDGECGHGTLSAFSAESENPHAARQPGRPPGDGCDDPDLQPLPGGEDAGDHAPEKEAGGAGCEDDQGARSGVAPEGGSPSGREDAGADSRDSPSCPAEGGADDDMAGGGVRADSLSAKIKALEAAIGRSREMFEPDSAGSDDYAGTPPVGTISWEDHDASDPAADAQRMPGGGDGDIIATEEAVLDEAALRDLVAEIVREELQGRLGERITRNVRKLVRREINRALAMRDFE